jgi:hypothetical protein
MRNASGASSATLFPSSLLLMVLGYCILYGALLWYTGGLPYVLDNNESFSSLWHAYNLYHFDLTKSMGLADEAFAYHAAAHPFVHTHQGNFPRLFAFVIFVLGATTIQSQIVVTTFTVGLAGVVLAYVFFTRIVDPLFAILFCLLLMTDYVLVAQWQMVTYRVWHLFFVFSSLLCVHLLSRRKVLGIALTVLNFACLFYYELVFVFFVSLSCALYAAIYLRKRWTDTVTFWASQAAGGTLALGALTAQLTLYMGWQDTLKDFRFTFLGRNYLAGSDGIARSAQEFYERHNIAFWYNLENGADFRSLRHFFGSLTYFEFQFHTPFWTTVCFVLLLGVFGGIYFRPSGENRPGLGRTAADHAGILRIRGLVWQALLVSAFVVACGLVVGAALNSDLLLGVATSWRPIFAPAAWKLAVIAMLALAIWWLAGRSSMPAVEARNTVRWLFHRAPPLLSINLLLCCVAALIVLSPYAYGQRYSIIWQEIAGRWAPRAWLLLTFFAVVTVSTVLVLGAGTALRERSSHALRGLLPLWGAALLAYMVTFYLSPAYIFSGYRYRLAPFTVFHVTTLSALAFYPLVLAARDALRRRPRADATSSSPASRVFGLICAGILVVTGWYWIAVQAAYLHLLPLDHYAFLRKLEQPPFRGKSFVVNGYAGPIAASTGQWAYMDDNLVRNLLVVSASSRELQLDTTYRWFADRHKNPAYQRPDYFVCIVPQSMYVIAEVAWRKAGAGAGWQHGCETHQLVRIARRQEIGGFSPGVAIAAADTDGPAKVGYERWVIVKLNWADAPKPP